MNETATGTPAVFAYVQDVVADWREYERIAAVVGDDRPEGMIVHLAGPTADGYRIIDVWRTLADWEAYRDERLRPAVRGLAGDSDTQGSTFQPLAVRHVMGPNPSPPHQPDRGQRPV